MATFSTGALAPPRELIQDGNTVVVSTKRPVVVYVNRLMEMIVSSVTSPSTPTVVEFRVAGSGAAIPRCEQVARYAVQALQGKYKHVIKSVTKRVEKGTTTATDLHVPDMVDEEAIFHMTSARRTVNTVSYVIAVTVR